MSRGESEGAVETSNPCLGQIWVLWGGDAHSESPQSLHGTWAACSQALLGGI